MGPNPPRGHNLLPWGRYAFATVGTAALVFGVFAYAERVWLVGATLQELRLFYLMRGASLALATLSVATVFVARLAHRLRAASKRTRDIIDALPDGILLADQRGRIIEVNPRAQELFGYTPDELLRKTVEALMPEQFRRAHTGHRADYLREPKARLMAERRDLVCLRKDGSEFPASIALGPIKTDGEMHVVCAVRDVSDRKQFEEQLRQSSKMEAIGRLASGVAHDFNNLMTIIGGYSQLLLARVGKDDPIGAYLKEINNAADRAASLTQQLLAFSRRQMLSPQVLDLNAVVAGMDKMLRRLIGEDVELLTQPRPGLGRVKVDRGQIEQVILNLAINARDAMPRGGKLILETANVELDDAYARTRAGTRSGPHVMLAVSDTGHGMDAETQARIFEPFFTTKVVGKGTGLGLATVYGVVKQSGGSIWVYSELGKGTTFKVYLPRVEEAPSVEQIEAGAAARGTETILLVEDEVGVRDLIQRVLESNGYKVLVAESASEAVPLAERHGDPIHLLLTDVVMPNTSGPEVAERLASTHPQTKVLYISGYTDNAVVHHGIVDRDKAFLQKPFSPAALLAKVREVLGV